MKLKKLVSLITLAGTIALSSQVVSGNVSQFKSITLLSNSPKIESTSSSSTNQNIKTNKNTKTPVVNENVKTTNIKNITTNENTNPLSNNTITLNNTWSQNIGTLTFNPTTNKIQFNSGWAETNPYASSSQELFAITLYSNNGQVIKSVNVYGGGQYAENALSQAFNNLDYTYGDIIQITYPYSSSRISISNVNGQSNYNISKTTSFVIQQSGLKEINTLNINPIYYTLNSNKTTISGTTTANTEVNIWINNKDYTTTSNANGDFSLNISANENITSSTNIEIESNGALQTINPTINPNVYKIQQNVITLNNTWQQSLGTITFNPQTSQLQVTKGNAITNPYASSTQELFAITLLSSNGQVIKTVNVYGNEWPEDALCNAFNNLKYTYGDIIQISYPYSSSKISISNIDGKTYNVNKTVSFVIEESGLKQVNTLKINPVYYQLNSNKITVSGTTTANTQVNIWIDNKDYTTTSNANGDFSLDITATNNITNTTNIQVVSNGSVQNITPTLNPNVYKIQNNSISLNNHWNQNIGTLSFNPSTNKIQFNSGWAETNPYASNTQVLFTVALYSNTGELIKSINVYGGGQYPENALSQAFNNLNYTYGDIIQIVYPYSSSEINISNVNGKTYNVNQTATFSIEKNGLVSTNMEHIKVNPFDVLGNGSVTSGTLSGSTNKPNQTVTVLVNGQTFTTKTNSNGEFSLTISDSNGFTDSTNIVVQTSGELATIVNPTAINTLGILKSNITISDKDQDGTFGQMVSFNPANMTVVDNNHSNFAVQLIDQTTGNVLASCTPSQFSVFSSSNNLNGASFKYGDIIAVYEPQEIELSMGQLLLNSGQSQIDCTNQFKCFEITQNGLVAVANKNLTTSQVLYTGTKNMTLTGKTLANTNVTISYGNTSKVVESNSNGEFSLDIPIDQAPIGSEVRVFVNNQNVSLLTVQYASNMHVSQNKIEVLNNTNIPIFDIAFNPVNQTLQVTQQPINDKEYTGAFYGNTLNISIINPITGNTIKSFSSNELNDVSSIVNQINNTPYTNGDIVEISYNPSYTKVNVYSGKNNIGNSTGAREYFEITNNGLENLNNKFVQVQPVDILGSNGNITKTNVEGTANPNTPVIISVDGQTFTGTTNSSGNFNIPITDINGFTSNTEITITTKGYIPTIIKPTISSDIKLANSYINFYNNNGNIGALVSSIAFNPETMQFTVNNYSNSFGNGQSHYFDLTLYNSQGQEISNSSINNGSTNQLTEALNGKSFSYGDIIGLSYNTNISKPVILNGNTVLGNISGNTEYFEITKDGLVSVKFGQNAYTSNVYWQGNNLVVNSNLANGQSESILNGNKKLVILNSSNQIIDSVDTTNLDNNTSSVQGIISESTLSNLAKGENYTFALDINNELFPIKVLSNIQSNSNFLLNANTDNLLTISIKPTPTITINNSSDISQYLNKINSNISSSITQNGNSDILTNASLNYDITANEFISRIGENNLENFINQSTANKEFINWVLNNQTAMQEYLEGTSQEGVNINGLQIWSNIWNTYANSRYGFNLKLAIATAIANANPIASWPCSGNIGNPVERYNIFETLNADGGMLPIFKTLDIKHLIYVVNTHIPNSQIMELRNIVLQNHNGFINSSNSGLNNIAYTINYNETNPHTGASVFGPDFYGPNPTILDVWYDGGVCGSTSYLGASACQVFGIPAQPVGQPGHCAFIYYTDGQWEIGNNIFGWSQSQGADVSGWSNGISTNSYTTNYDLLYQNADTPALEKSNEYLWLVNSNISYQEKMNAINEAISIQPLNLRAWLDKINLMETNNDLTAQDYLNLSNEIISTFKQYPMPMFDTLLQIKDQILQKGTTEQFNEFVNSITNALNSVTNSNQQATAKEMLQSMSQEGLVDNEQPVLGTIILDTWGRNTTNIIFQNGVISANGSHTWIGSSNNDGINIKLYSSNMDLIKNINAEGEEFGANQQGYDLTDLINGTKYTVGDIISINYNPGANSKGQLYLKNKNLQVNKIANNVVYQITNNGLVALNGTYTAPNGSKYTINNGNISK